MANGKRKGSIICSRGGESRISSQRKEKVCGLSEMHHNLLYYVQWKGNIKRQNQRVNGEKINAKYAQSEEKIRVFFSLSSPFSLELPLFFLVFIIFPSAN